MYYEELTPSDCCMSLHGLRFIVESNELKNDGTLQVVFEDGKRWMYRAAFVGSPVNHLGRGTLVLVEDGVSTFQWPDGSETRVKIFSPVSL